MKHWFISVSQWRIASFIFALLLIICALAGLFSRGLNLGLDFTGGYLTEFSTTESVTQADMQTLLSNYLPEGFKLTKAEGGKQWSVRQADNTSEATDNDWLVQLVEQSNVEIIPQETIYIGSQVGGELINQGGLALLTAIIVVLLYLAFRFEWRLAMGAVFALFHDVIIVLGVFAWLGTSFDLTVLASLLAIIGYSLNDSIIVGDRIRELMKINTQGSLNKVVNSAIKSTLVRTLITSGTTLVTILSVWLFAGASLGGFAQALFTGIVVGTYSSIALAATVPQFLGLQRDYYQLKAEPVCQLP